MEAYLVPIVGAIFTFLAGVLGTWLTYKKAKSGEKKEYFEIVTIKFKELQEEAEKRALRFEKKLQEVEEENDDLRSRLREFRKELESTKRSAQAAKKAYEKRIEELEGRVTDVEKSGYILVHKHVREILWNNTNLGWAFVSHEGVILEANETLHEMLGYKDSELVGMHFVTITADEDTKEDMENFMKLMKGEIHHYKMKKKYIRKTGELWEATLDVFHIEDETFVLGRVEAPKKVCARSSVGQSA